MFELQFFQSLAAKELLAKLKDLAGANITVLLEGETGTGKNYLAQQLHALGGPSCGAFLPLLCGGIPETLVESELFGYEKGAFTGAEHRKAGLIELACGGTLFLDEIENMSIVIQGKLLRFLDEKKFRRLGGLEELEVDFQLVCATNTNLKRAAEQGVFRLDLFFRISAVHLVIPPLRNRPDDILSLAQHFLAENNKAKDHVPSLSKAAKETLLKYPWPGNIRELKNVMQIATRFAKGKEIHPEDFTWVLQEWNNLDEDQSLAAAERRHIAKILKQHDYHRAQTAKALKLTETAAAKQDQEIRTLIN